MTTAAFHVKGMTCGGCESSISKAVALVPGVTRVDASHEAERVDVDFVGDADDDAVRTAVEDAGFEFAGRR